MGILDLLKLGDLDTLTEKLKVKFKVKNASNNPIPKYESNGASGFDIRAFIDEPIVLEPQSYGTIPTGLYFDIPANFELQLRPRSGLASKFGVTVLNSPATIDSDYIGQVMVILINHGKEPFTINSGDRIAQGVFAPSPTNMFDIVSVKEINKITDRGENGLGSTGIK